MSLKSVQGPSFQSTPSLHVQEEAPQGQVGQTQGPAGSGSLEASQHSFQSASQEVVSQQGAVTTAQFAQNAPLAPGARQSSLSLQIAQGTGKLAIQPEAAAAALDAMGGTRPAQHMQTQGPARVEGPTQAQSKEQIVQEFYDAMKAKDFDKIMSLYHPDAVFSDPAFPDISGKELRGMWKLITGNEGLVVSSRDVKAQADGSVTGHWDANYELIKGNPIFNQIDSKFEFKDGKIIKHTDSFNFKTWADQAFPGVFGKLIGTRAGHWVMRKLVLPWTI